MKGAAWEAVKDLDPETDLRVRGGFARLLSVLDKNYEWESSSELSKVIDEYLFVDGRLPGETITALLARNRDATRRFTKTIQSHYNEAADAQFQTEMKRWRELRSDYIYELEARRQRNPRRNVSDQRPRVPRDDGADGAENPPLSPGKKVIEIPYHFLKKIPSRTNPTSSTRPPSNLRNRVRLPRSGSSGRACWQDIFSCAG